MKSVWFVVNGEPVAKARPRVTKSGIAYTPKKTVEYENLVRLEYQRQCGGFKFGDDSALDVRMTAYFSIPKSASKKARKMMEDYQLRPTKKPDCDNVVKAILDSLNGIAYRDDSQVVECQIRKYYSQTPRVTVKISETKG